MSTSEISGILVTELSKISDQIVYSCIILSVSLIILGLAIGMFKNFVRRFFNQQFKRSCVPDGVRVGSVALSPRGAWKMPSDAVSKIWLEELENL